MTNGQGRGKDKTIAGILGIILGSLGIHHFYLGSNTVGILYLVVWAAGGGITFVTCGLGAPLLGIPGLLGFIEGILLLVMPQPEFDAKYNARAPEGMEFVFTKPTPPASAPPAAPPPAQ